jgi:AraC-like DNA-binding protein
VIETGPDEKIYPVAKLATIVEALAAEGVKPQDALRQVRLDAGAISSPQTRVSLNQIIACCRNALSLSQDPFFAYHAGLRFHASTQGMYGFAILSSTDHRRTMDLAIKYHRLATPLADIAFREEGGRAIWIINPAPYPEIDAALYRFLVDMQLGIHLSLHRDVMGPSFAPAEIHLRYEPPPDEQRHSNAFGCPVRFGQRENRLLFDATWLRDTAHLGNDITNSVVLRLCDELLDDFQLRTGVSGKVRDVLVTALDQPKRLDTVALELNISPRTLRRRLQEEGKTFRDVVDELRTYVAVKYLRDTSLTIEDVAEALGFSDSASFRHAFHRWTQSSPQEFRNGLKGQRGARLAVGRVGGSAPVPSRPQGFGQKRARLGLFEPLPAAQSTLCAVSSPRRDNVPRRLQISAADAPVRSRDRRTSSNA